MYRLISATPSPHVRKVGIALAEKTFDGQDSTRRRTINHVSLSDSFGLVT